MDKLNEDDYLDAADELCCEVAIVKAVCAVESNGSGFDKLDRPKILYEGHIFSRLTKKKYDIAFPELSYPKYQTIYYGRNQYNRLAQATTLNEEAALKSCSWGLFQILGENYIAAGFDDVFTYVEAMKESEYEQLLAFISYCKSENLDKYLINKQWTEFAKRYNGPAYYKNAYDTKMAQAYEQYK